MSSAQQAVLWCFMTTLHVKGVTKVADPAWSSLGVVQSSEGETSSAMRCQGEAAANDH
jgi:hypothetical protein